MLVKHKEIFDKIKYLMKAKNNNSDDYHEKYLKIRIKSDDDLSLQNILLMYDVVILIKSVANNEKNTILK